MKITNISISNISCVRMCVYIYIYIYTHIQIHVYIIIDMKQYYASLHGACPCCDPAGAIIRIITTVVIIKTMNKLYTYIYIYTDCVYIHIYIYI